MSDPFGLMQFAECEHKQLKCEKCGARSDIRGWQTFTGQDKELLQLREENESITARLAAAQTRNECPICGLTPGAISTCFCEECVGELRQRLAAAEARSYERIAEIDEIREQLANAREGDNWVLMARESIANGNCPWCFCMDEGPHQPGCYVNEIEAENSRLHRELCEMSEPRLKLHATIQQLAERLAEAEAREQELRVELAIEKAFNTDTELYYRLLAKRDEAAKGGRDATA